MLSIANKNNKTSGILCWGRHEIWKMVADTSEPILISRTTNASQYKDLPLLTSVLFQSARDRISIDQIRIVTNICVETTNLTHEALT